MSVNTEASLRNSPLRKKLSPLIESVTFPFAEHVHPDTVTILGAAGRAAISIWSAIENSKPNRQPKHTTLRAGLAIAFSLCDALDGSLARTRQKLGLPTSANGAIVDGLSDRFTNLSSTISQAYTARKRKNPVGEVSALTAAATASLPALAKQITAEKGIPSFESGKYPLSKLGTHLPRSIFGIASDIYPDLAPILNLTSTVGNLSATTERLCPDTSDTFQKLNPAESQKATKMKKAYLVSTAITLTFISAYLISRSKSIKD